MILKFKVYEENAMGVMYTLANNGYHPVMSTKLTNSVPPFPEYTIAIDTDDVINEKKDYCDLKLDYLKKPCTPDCPDFKECWDGDEEKEEISEEEVANAILKALFESAGKNSRILNE